MSLRDTQPDVTLERSADKRGRKLLEYLKVYAHELREGGEPMRALFRQMMWGADQDFSLGDLPAFLRLLADWVETPALDMDIVRMGIWLNHERISLSEVTERRARLRFSASGDCS